MTQEITIEQLYQGMQKALAEGIKVPYFDDTGKEIGQVKEAIFFGDAIKVMVFNGDEFLGVKRIT